MFMIGNILIAVGNILHMIIFMYNIMLIVAIVISWVRPNPDVDFVRTLISVVLRLTEPALRLVRRFLPRALLSTGIDFSPMILLAILYAIDIIVAGSIVDLGIRLKYGQTPIASLF